MCFLEAAVTRKEATAMWEMISFEIAQHKANSLGENS